MKGIPMYGSNEKPCATIQISEAKQASGLEIGESVSITITGTVKAIEGPREAVHYMEGGSESKMMPGQIEIEVKGIKVGAIESADVETEK
jgi:hypothetical protein